MIDVTLDGRVAIVSLQGEIDMTSVGPVTSEFDSRIPTDAAGVVIDLSEVTYLDSAGIQMLFDLIRSARTSRLSVSVLVPESSMLNSLLKITNVEQACPVVSERAAAIQAAAEHQSY
jgi:anti-anti-sigma factor